MKQKFTKFINSLNPKRIYNDIRSIILPDYSKTFSSKIDENSLITNIRKNTIYLITLYVLFYFSLYILGFSYYNEINESIIKDLTEKQSSFIVIFFNTYPFNIVYVLILLIFFSLTTSIITFFLGNLLEDYKKSFKMNLAFSINANSIWILSLILIVIINTLFPFNQPNGVIIVGLLIGIWLIIFSGSIYLSTKAYNNSMSHYYDANSKRTTFIWLLSNFFIIYFIYSLIV